MANILPTTDLSVMHVRNILSYPSTDVGTLCGGVAACAEKINKWAKYKPVRYNFSDNRPSDWWKAQDGNCGLNVPVYTTIEALITAIKNNTAMWNYMPPRGGSSEPFRLGDYRGYNHNAINPVTISTLPPIVYKDSMSTIGMAIDMAAIDSALNNLSLVDIGTKYPLKDYYPGVVTVRSDINAGYFITDSATLSGGGGGGVDIPTSQFLSGYTYSFVFVLSSIMQTSYGPNSSPAIFIPAPADKYIQSVKFESKGVEVSVIASYNGSTKIDWTLYVTNKVLTSATVSNIVLRLTYADYDGKRPMQQGEYETRLADITVALNESKTTSGAILTNSYLQDINERGGRVYLTYNIGTTSLVYESDIEMPA